MLFKIPEIYTKCRAGCFRNDYFYLCLNVTLVDDDTQEKVGKHTFKSIYISPNIYLVDQLVAIDGGHFLGVDIFS